MADFLPGERLQHRDENKREIRVVTFRGLEGKDQAAVGFGRRSDFSEPLSIVPLATLSRPGPPEQFYPAQLPPSPPPAPEVPLEARRQKLTAALEALREATATVAASELAANRAQQHVLAQHEKLRRYANLESQAAERLVADLVGANGCSTNPNDQAWVEHELAKRNCTLAETAYNQVARLLSEARAKEQRCKSGRLNAAAYVTGSIMDREIATLHQMEQQTAALRTKLKSMIGFYPDVVDGTPRSVPISAASSAVINTVPQAEIADPVGYFEKSQLREQRQEPIKTLFEKLVNGDVNADIE